MTSTNMQPAKDVKALRAVLLITAVFLAVEAVGGVLSGSLALLADAGHMLTDVASLAPEPRRFQAGSARPRSPEKTFGWRRTEIFAALHQRDRPLGDRRASSATKPS